MKYPIEDYEDDAQWPTCWKEYPFADVKVNQCFYASSLEGSTLNGATRRWMKNTGQKWSVVLDAERNKFRVRRLS